MMMSSFEMPLDERAIAQLAKTVIYKIPDAVIYADRAGTIQFWNVGATRIFDFSTTEAVGQSLDIIIPKRLREGH
jgi:PAS domain S-box-containing protein